MEPVDLSKPDEWPSIETALKDQETRQDFAGADVIFGHDRSQGPAHKTVFAGRAKLEHVVKTGKAQALDVLGFSYDQRTPSLEWFVVACMKLRGGCEYMSGEEEAERARFVDELHDAYGAGPLAE